MGKWEFPALIPKGEMGSNAFVVRSSNATDAKFEVRLSNLYCGTRFRVRVEKSLHGTLRLDKEEAFLYSRVLTTLWTV